VRVRRKVNDYVNLVLAHRRVHGLLIADVGVDKGIALGIAVGLFFGEPASMLQPLADIYIRLMQVTVLPYLVMSLVVGFGQLEARQARRLALARAGLVYKNRHGHYSFAVPLMGQFIRRTRPDLLRTSKRKRPAKTSTRKSRRRRT